eukprot:TRINITY_DN34593_c0_g1_i1.p1 TRINITY_DN34593_c0_g1~~TRINITY_DN34593_c0_g1_i1.p1  ORF type:complete len:286 (+),score=54.07 TRINITY_DN34593_c0_g1_i1:68-859(+)
MGEGLVPLADLFNHKAAVGTGAKSRSSRSSRSHALDIAVKNAGLKTDSLHIMAVSPLAKGQEVFNCYGRYGNAKLLADYGFLCQDNPHNTAVFRPAELVQVAAKLQKVPVSEVRARLRTRLRPWRFESATAVRREVERSAGETSSDEGFDDDELKGFSVGATGSAPVALSKVAAAMVTRPCKRGRQGPSAQPVLQAALEQKRRALKRRCHSHGKDISAKRAALANQLRTEELEILDALEQKLGSGSKASVLRTRAYAKKRPAR